MPLSLMLLTVRIHRASSLPLQVACFSGGPPTHRGNRPCIRRPCRTSVAGGSGAWLVGTWPCRVEQECPLPGGVAPRRCLFPGGSAVRQGMDRGLGGREGAVLAQGGRSKKGTRVAVIVEVFVRWRLDVRCSYYRFKIIFSWKWWGFSCSDTLAGKNVGP